MAQIIELYKTDNIRMTNAATKDVHKKYIRKEESILLDIENQIHSAITESKSVLRLIYSVNKLLFEKANKDPHEIKLLIEEYFMNKDRYKDLNTLLVKTIQEKGLETAEVNPYLNEKEIASIFPTIPMHFIGSLLAQESKLEEEQIKRITKICLNGLI